MDGPVPLFFFYGFYGLTAVTLAAAGVAVLSRSTRRATRALAVCALCVALMEALLLRAPAVGAAVFVALAAVAAPLLASAGADKRAHEPPSAGRAAGAVALVVALASFAYVLVGTIARQFVWYGRALPEPSSFGDASSIGQSFVELDPALIVVLPLVAATALLCASETLVRGAATR